MELSPAGDGGTPADRAVVRRPPEVEFADELAALAAADEHARPPGWRLSPRAVRSFIVGADDDALERPIARKLYGDDALVERAIVTLTGTRALLLVGEPGTAKSMLSELLAAAISGTSAHTIQGTAGTTEDHIKYSWNYALLLAQGPSREALVPSPLYRGLEQGLIVRFEEVTRCPPEIQDTLVSVLSDKVLHVPELGDDAVVPARRGFNLIATANTRDRGVHEMSAALKRRFNFETVPPIADPQLELQLVKEQAGRLLAEAEAEVEVPDDVLELLVTTFQDLRTGRTAEGTVIDSPSTVLSTAEAVSVAFAASLDARYFGSGRLEPRHLVSQLLGTVIKDREEDLRKLRQYFDVVVKTRGSRSRLWRSYYRARKVL
ncbi:MAG: AAA family ATPase [Acidobacteriota bacterium]